jgi:hypothetical protein
VIEKKIYGKGKKCIAIRDKVSQIDVLQHKSNLARFFNFSFRYLDDVYSPNNLFNSVDYVGRIYHIELEIKDTYVTVRSASYIGFHMEIDIEGRLKAKLYNKRDDFNIPIVNFALVCRNVPAAHTNELLVPIMISSIHCCC